MENVSYEIDRRVWSDSYDSEEECANYLIHDLKLDSGEINFEADKLHIKGISNGKTIEITQSGEFDMYGGPYDPKMKTPVVKYDDRDITNLVIDVINEYTGENSKTPDVSRTDMWCHILTKLEVLSHLKPDDDLRGTSSIIDTGLFDFKIK